MNINKKYYLYKTNRKKMNFISLSDSSIQKSKHNDCNKCVIIIPYRNREEHLNIFLSSMKDLNVKILIVEQDNNKKFNRGWLLNVGFTYYKDKYEKFIFHDVDSIPSDNLKKFYCYFGKKTIHLAHLPTYKYTFETFFGGILSISKNLFIKMNGFPHLEGWGGEDDILYNRYVKYCYKRYKIYKPKKGHYKLLDHSSPTDSEINENKKKNILDDLENKNISGLSNLTYKIKKIINLSPKVLHIKVDYSHIYPSSNWEN